MSDPVTLKMPQDAKVMYIKMHQYSVIFALAIAGNEIFDCGLLWFTVVHCGLL